MLKHKHYVRWVVGYDADLQQSFKKVRKGAMKTAVVLALLARLRQFPGTPMERGDKILISCDSPALPVW